MKRHLIYIVILFCLAIVCSCHRRYQYPAVLQQADSLCVANPDSAFLLLDSLHYRQPMTKKELARYALLLAKATDKTYQSLIPCDSLLNFALDYYKEPTADRATALLYKGCLEDEVNHDEDAIKHLQEARLILQNYPEEVSTRRITLGLLGDLYYQHKYFKDCLPVYQEALELCETDVDKSIAYQDIASYYTMTEKKDSALYYHHFALQHANKDKDSLLIANEYHYLGLCHNVFSQVDSALYYEKLALDYIPTKMPKGKIYYQIGSLIRTLGNTDQAAYYMGLAKEDSVFNSAYMVNRVLGKIETERGNYKEANELYIQYVEHLDSLYTDERSVDVQQLVYDYNIKLQLNEERAKEEKNRNKIVSISVVCILILVIILIFLFFRHKQFRQNQFHALEEMKLKQAALRNSIKDNLNTVKQLRNELNKRSSDIDELVNIIAEKEEAIKKYQIESIEVSNRYFKRTPTYASIISESKKSRDKKRLRIFTIAEQNIIKEEIFSIYFIFIEQLRRDHPSLKEDDLLLLCLEKAGLSNQAIALCLGSTDPHIVYARRSRMKDRVSS